MRSLILICALTLSATAQPPNLRLPDESTGIDGIARTLISVFDQADIIALGETHQWRLDTDLRIAVVLSALRVGRARPKKQTPASQPYLEPRRQVLAGVMSALKRVFLRAAHRVSPSAQFRATMLGQTWAPPVYPYRRTVVLSV
jgi:hypothetical protein